MKKRVGWKENFHKDHYIKMELQEAAKCRLEGLAASLGKLAQGFGSLTQTKDSLDNQDMDRIFEELSLDVCRPCSKCDICWQEQFEDSYEAACGLLAIGRNKGVVAATEVPGYFMESCICPDRLLKEVNHCFSIARMKLIWHNRMAESRVAVAEQLMEMAKVVTDFSEEINAPGELYRMKKWMIVARLRMLHMRVRRLILFHHKERGLEIHMEGKGKKGRCMMTKDVALQLSKVLGCRLVPRSDSKRVMSNDWGNYIFCEDTNFKVLSGVARASKVMGDLSGDNFSLLHLNIGEMVMLLSDGMGSGEMAYKESENVIEMLEQLLETGIEEVSALRLINSILVLKSEKTCFSTIDMCALNLYSGTCEFVKVGAASTYIKRGDRVETIRSSSLPAGILNGVNFEQKEKKLFDGDYVIMVSDGVLDCISGSDKEEFLQKLISKISVKNPQEIANTILAAALECHGYEPVDDMTVLVTGLWAK